MQEKFLSTENFLGKTTEKFFGLGKIEKKILKIHELGKYLEKISGF